MEHIVTDEGIIIIPDADMSLSAFFDRFCIPAKKRYLLKRDNNILIDGRPVSQPDPLISAGTEILIRNEAEPPGFPLSEKECRVVYEDDIVYVVHKDSGIIIHGDEDDCTCLASMAALWQKNHGIVTPVRYLHRLDRETTGLVLFVRQPFFKPWLDRQLSEKNIHRTYYAITRGSAALHEKFTFAGGIGRDRHVSGRYRVSPSGKEALTEAECIRKKNGYLVLRCTLQTGRTHQIRVHLSHAGMGIVNDPLYGRPSADFRNMGLWACRIDFPDPLTGMMHTVHDIPYPDMRYFD